jgi:hypothetical protein
MARDIYHDIVVTALKGDGWTITHDPLILTYGVSAVEVDLGAERMLAAEKGTEKIAVEIKSFLGTSRVYDFHQAIGQFVIYKMALKRNQELRTLFLAITSDVYQSFFQDQEMVKDAILELGLKILVVNVKTKSIDLWVK